MLGGVELSLMRTHNVHGTVERIDAAVVGIERHGGYIVGPVAELRGLDDRPAAEGSHVLRAVEQRQAFLGGQVDGLPPHLLQQFGSTHQLTLVFHLAQSDERQAEMGQRHEVAGAAHRALHVDHGVDLVVEEVDETLHGIEFAARIAIGERLYLEQDHQLHDLVGDALTDTAGMTHHQVDLQLRELVFADGDIAQRSETGRHAIDRHFGFGNLLVEILTASRDAMHGIVAQLEFVVAPQNLPHLVESQVACADFMYVHSVVVVVPIPASSLIIAYRQISPAGMGRVLLL